MTPAAAPFGGGDAMRYLRPGANRGVRRRRRVRVTARAVVWIAAWSVGAVAAMFGFREGERLMMDPAAFPLRSVVVEGAHPEVNAAVRGACSDLIGRNLFSVPLAEVDRRARRHREVTRATVRRRLPSTILVLLEPRGVEALVLAGSTIRMVGPDGSDMGAYGGRHAAVAPPVLTGVVAPTSAETRTRVERGLAALRRLREQAPGFAAALSALDLSRSDRLVATLRDFSPPVYLSPADPGRNLDRLASVRRRLEAADLDVEYVDLRFRDRAVVLPVREENGDAIRGA